MKLRVHNQDLETSFANPDLQMDADGAINPVITPYMGGMRGLGSIGGINISTDGGVLMQDTQTEH